MVEAAGIEPCLYHKTRGLQQQGTSATKTAQKSMHDDIGQGVNKGPASQNTALSEQNPDTSLQANCAICVQKLLASFTPDLRSVVEVWDRLPEHIRTTITTIIETTTNPGK